MKSAEKLIVIISGKKQSGKDLVATMMAAHYINLFSNEKIVASAWKSGEVNLHERNSSQYAGVVQLSYPKSDMVQIERYGVHVISFAEKLKQFCHEVLGLTQEQCWGSDKEKNAVSTLWWDNLPFQVRWKYRKNKWLPGLRSGLMTGREVLQVFGTELIRDWHNDAWVDATFRAAMKSPARVVFIPDCRFPNELGLREKASERVSIKTLRLRRTLGFDSHVSESALDHVPDHHFDSTFHKGMTLQDYEYYSRLTLNEWLTEAGMLPPGE